MGVQSSRDAQHRHSGASANSPKAAPHVFRLPIVQKICYKVRATTLEHRYNAAAR